MVLQRRVTRWTDTRGVPRQDLRGLFETVWLDRFKSAGIPAAWLHPSGSFSPFGSGEWEAQGDLAGCFADGLYIAAQASQGFADDGNPDPNASERVKSTVDLMGSLASKIGCGGVVAEFRDDLKGVMHRDAIADGYKAIQGAWDAVAGEIPYDLVLADPELYARCREAVKPLWREQLKRVVATNVANGSEHGETVYARLYEEPE